MKLRSSTNKRSFGHRPSDTERGAVRFVRIGQRLARFANDDSVVKKAALTHSIVEEAHVAAASKSAAVAQSMQADKIQSDHTQADKRFAVSAWEDEGGAVRPLRMKT